MVLRWVLKENKEWDVMKREGSPDFWALTEGSGYNAWMDNTHTWNFHKEAQTALHNMRDTISITISDLEATVVVIHTLEHFKGHVLTLYQPCWTGLGQSVWFFKAPAPDVDGNIIKSTWQRTFWFNIIFIQLLLEWFWSDCLKNCLKWRFICTSLFKSCWHWSRLYGRINQLENQENLFDIMRTRSFLCLAIYFTFSMI